MASILKDKSSKSSSFMLQSQSRKSKEPERRLKAWESVSLLPSSTFKSVVFRVYVCVSSGQCWEQSGLFTPYPNSGPLIINQTPRFSPGGRKPLQMYKTIFDRPVQKKPDPLL